MLFALTLLVVVAFGSEADCVEPTPGSPLALAGTECAFALTAQDCSFDTHDFQPALPVGSYLYTFCPCSCPDGASTAPEEETCTQCDGLNTAMMTCIATCGDTAIVCGSEGGACVTHVAAFQGCIADCEAAENTDMPVDDMSSCDACSAEEDAGEACLVNQCLSPCMAPSSTACYDCATDECASDFEDIAACSIDNCATGTYDVLRVNSYCGSDCGGDCTTVDTMAVNFDTCYNDDEDNTSWSAVCNSDGATVTVSDYTNLNCAGTPATKVLTNGECPTGELFTEEWFGGCGGETYDGPSNSSPGTSFAVFAFILSAILY